MNIPFGYSHKRHYSTIHNGRHDIFFLKTMSNNNAVEIGKRQFENKHFVNFVDESRKKLTFYKFFDCKL